MHDLTKRRLGRGLILLVSGLLFLDGATQLASPPPIKEAMTQIGFPAALMPGLALLTFACSLLLAFRATARLGAILTTGFLGGAIALHVRAGEIGSPPQLVCIALGMAVWLGLLLADFRISPDPQRQAAKPALLDYGISARKSAR
jgi:hypothetical protein